MSEVTGTERQAAFAKAKDTIIDGRLPRSLAEKIRDGLRRHDLCDERLWERFLDKHPFPSNGGGARIATPTADADHHVDVDLPPPTPVEVLRRRADRPARLKTGIAAIDDATRGGLPGGTIVTFTGGPGSAKSTLMTQIARIFAGQHGSVVVSLHADEGCEPAAVRVGQQFGCSRDGLETGDAATLADFESKMKGIR
jgi:hypothetical protein